jgi:hypothetical protein
MVCLVIKTDDSSNKLLREGALKTGVYVGWNLVFYFTFCDKDLEIEHDNFLLTNELRWLSSGL